MWTAGVAPSPLVKLLGAKTDRAGRAAVGPFMDVEGVAGVFVVGDASSVVCTTDGPCRASRKRRSSKGAMSGA